MLPAAGIFLLCKGGYLRQTRWPYLGVGLFIPVNVNMILNMIIYNLNSGLDSLAAAHRTQTHYTGGETLTLAVYLERVGAWSTLLMNHLGGAAGWPTTPQRWR